jgi:hypothetical protein
MLGRRRDYSLCHASTDGEPLAEGHRGSFSGSSSKVFFSGWYVGNSALVGNRRPEMNPGKALSRRICH